MNGNYTSKIDISKFNDETMIHKIESNPIQSPKMKYLLIIVIILAGIFSGYLLTNNKPVAKSSLVTGKTSAGKSVGSNDRNLFPDSTEGKLEAGGIDGEGTHKLIKPGGDSQTVYLTSSVLDLNEFVGKKVKIWGKTYATKKAGWFMDVGNVEIKE